jgi:hypothetical protein
MLGGEALEDAAIYPRGRGRERRQGDVHVAEDQGVERPYADAPGTNGRRGGFGPRQCELIGLLELRRSRCSR